MKIFRIAGLGVLCLLPYKSPAAAARHPNQPVALVYSLAGEAKLKPRARRWRPLRLFDRVSAGATLELGPGSRLALALVNGIRYELGEGSRVTLGPKDLASRTGPVRPLPPAPPLPRLSPIAEDDHPGPRAGAVRIRSEIISGLYPDRGATSLASATRLRFDPSPAAPKYRVQIVDQEGKVVFNIDTQASEVNVPPEILAPGGTYRWTVETRDRPGAVARGEATLVTLDASQVRAREELRRWGQRSGAAGDLRLAEAVDHALGLREESRHSADDTRCPFSAPELLVETVIPGSRTELIPGDVPVRSCFGSAFQDRNAIGERR